MNRNVLIYSFLIAFTCCVLIDTTSAVDRVEREGAASVIGDIVTMTPEKVTVKTSRGNEDVSVAEISRIRYDKEPPKLNLLRAAAASGRLEEALEGLAELEKENFEGARVLQIKQDISFLQAYCKANLAIVGAAPPADAEAALKKFTTDNASSYHYLEASELLGDIYVLQEKFAEAEKEYGRLSASTIPGIKMRGLVAKGNALLRQNKAAVAQSTFESVLAIPAGDDPNLQRSHNAAKLGKAACMAAQNQLGPAVTLVNSVIDNAPEEGALYAKAYNTLGFCYKASKKPKDAMLAYLHVDTLYPNFPQEHAEALYYLVGLWEGLNKPEYAKEARETLTSRYKSSSWAKKIQ